MKKIKREVRYARYRTALSCLSLVKDNTEEVCGFCLALVGGNSSNPAYFDGVANGLRNYPELYAFRPVQNDRWEKNPAFWFNPYTPEGKQTRIDILTSIIQNKLTGKARVIAWVKQLVGC